MVEPIISGRYPRSAYAVRFNQGPRALGLSHGVAVCGPKTSAGSGTAATPVRCDGTSEALALAGPGSHLHLALLSALKLAKGKVPIYAVPTAAPAVGPVAASLATVLGGAATEDGVLSIMIGTDLCEIPVPNTTTNDALGALIAAAYHATTGTQPFCPATAAFVAGTHTLTWTDKCTGTEGNQNRIDIFNIPAGLTFTVSSGLFTGGAGVGGYAAAYAAVCGVLRDVDFLATCTATAAGLTATGMLQDAVQAAIDPEVGHLITAVVGQNGTEGDITTMCAGLDLGGTDIDEPAVWFACLGAVANQASPGQLAGALAGARAAATVSDRNKHWAAKRAFVLDGIPVPRLRSAYPGLTSLKVMLGAGVTPVEYDEATGTARIVRSQTCKHVTSGGADYRSADSNVPDVTAYVVQDQSQALYDEFGACSGVDDVDGREPEDIGPDTVSPSLMDSSALGRYKSKFVGSLGWCDAYYRNGAGKSVPVDDQYIFSRDLVDSGQFNGAQAIVVKRQVHTIGCRYDEVGY